MATRKLNTTIQAELKDAAEAGGVTLAAATTAWRKGGTVAEAVATASQPATTKAVTKVAKLSKANQAKADELAKAQADAKQAKVAAPRTPRSTAADKVLAAAEAGGWSVEHIAMGDEREVAFRMLNPHRGKRNWFAKATRGNAVLWLSTLENSLGATHLDRCTFEYAGIATVVEMVYEVTATLRMPVAKGGVQVSLHRDDAKAYGATLADDAKVNAIG